MIASRGAGFARILSKMRMHTAPEKFEYRQAIPEDRDRIMKFLLTHFVKDEPCNRALKISASTLETIISGTLERSLKDPFSTIVTVPEKDDELAGCIMNSVWNRSDPMDDADFGMGEFPENVRLFVNLLNGMHSNFWNLAPKTVNSVIHREIASVAPLYTRRGISTRLLVEGLDKKLLQKYQIGGVVSEATSLANQTLEKKHGFRTLLAKPYSEVVDSKGNKVLQLDDGTTHLLLNFKKIE